MNKICLAFLIASLASCHGSGVPTFSWLQSPQPVLKITYPNGLSDVAVLKSYNPIPVQSYERFEDVDPCIYDGYLSNEETVYVTLTGCAHTNTFNVQFRSKNLDHSMFAVVDGKVEAVESIFGKKEINRDGEYVMIQSSVFGSRQAEPSVAKNERALNPNGYKATLKIRYDENFAANFGSDAVNTIRRVMVQVQNMWMWPSLTSSVTFVIDPSVDAVAGKFVVNTEDYLRAGAYSTFNHNLNLMMAFRNNRPGVVGGGHIGTVCDAMFATNRTALCEYFRSEIMTAQIVAHEFGHNFNMLHDFNVPRLPKYDSKGKQCTGIGGVMDYYGWQSQWSPCSVEDFTALVNSPCFCLIPN